jgi:hypothetical protein
MGNLCNRGSLEEVILSPHDEKDQDDVIQILVAGSSQVGKSTLLRQLRIVTQENPFPEEDDDGEWEQFQVTIRSNIIDLMYIFCLTLQDNRTNDLTEEQEELVAWGQCQEFLLLLLLQEQDDYDEDTKAMMFLQYKSVITKLWNSEAMSARWEECESEGLVDWTKRWFLERLEEISQPDYRPQHVDILRMNTTNTNQEVRLEIQGITYRFTELTLPLLPDYCDIHIPSADAVLYVACLADYDLWDKNHQKNRMAESIEGFQKLVQHPELADAIKLVIFNKRDLLGEKLSKSPLADQAPFADYKGQKNNMDDAILYLAQQFEHETAETPWRLWCGTDYVNLHRQWGELLGHVNSKIMRKYIFYDG